MPVVAVAVAILVAFAVTGAAGVPRAVAGAFAVLLTSIGGSQALHLSAIEPRTVRASTGSRRIVFRGPESVLQLLTLVSSISLIGASSWTVAAGEWAVLRRFDRSMVVAAFVLGVALLVELLVRLRRSAGLSVSPERLWGVRAGPKVDLAWGEVRDVSVREAKNRRVLVLTTREAGVLLVPEAAVSGDVYAVGTVVKYYLENPGERWRLAEGLDAVMQVDREVRAKRFEPL